MDQSEIIARIKSNAGRWGIGTAATYLRQLESVGGLKGLNISQEKFNQAIKEAENKLTFCDPDMVVVNSDDDDGRIAYKLVEMETPEGEKLLVPQPGKKRRNAKREPTPGSVMEFEAIITTGRVDRDGDILEPKGAIVDPKSPLLWQHNPWEPIGKLIEVTKQNTKQVRGRFAIIDSPLGRDAAQLIEFGALRISHGFLPTEWKDRTDKKTDEWLGWHITAFDVMEVSVVSVPSNVDAVITAFDAQKLVHPLTKAWAKGIKDNRQVQGVGVNFETKDVVKYWDTPPAPEDTEWDGDAASKRWIEWSTVPETEEVDLGLYAKGFTWSEGDGEQLGDYKLPHHDILDGEVVVVKQALSAVVASLNGARGGIDLEEADRKRVYNHAVKHYKDAFPGSDIPELKDASAITNTKSGRSLSKANAASIQEARENVVAAKELDEQPRAGKALLREVVKSLDDVLASNEQADDDDNQRGFTGNDVMMYLAVHATAAELKEAKGIVGHGLTRIAKQASAKLVDRILNR